MWSRRQFPFASTLPCRIRGDGLALDLIRRPSEVVVPLGQRPQLTAHLPEELPVVGAFDGGQLLRVLGQEVSESPHQARPLGAYHRAPGTFIEGRAGGSYSPVHILFARLGGRGPHPVRVRVDALEGITGEGVYPLAPDQHLVIAGLAGRWGFDQPRLHVPSSRAMFWLRGAGELAARLVRIHAGQS